MRFHHLLLAFLVLMGSILSGRSQTVDEGHIEVCMRMIGHEVLLMVGDSTSRVLPIEKQGERYKIQFDTDFAFNPEELASRIDSVVLLTQVASSYRVEVSQCGPGEIVYSYEIGRSVDSDIVPCGTRSQPKDCYYLLITLFEIPQAVTFHMKSTDFDADLLSATVDSVAQEKQLGKNYKIEIEKCDEVEATEDHSFLVDTVDCEGYLVTIMNSDKPNNIPSAEGELSESSSGFGLQTVLEFGALIILVLLIIFLIRKRAISASDPNVIPLGKYYFDKRKMELRYGKDKIELTSKESDLLALLHHSANSTIEREDILRIVWGDEGDYVGRTLDVFISKLRKKLGADSSIKIVNIRGVGYKLILDADG